MAKLPSAVVDVRSTDPIPDPIIPDSATNHWKIATGSGSTVYDDIGSDDATINNATWSSGTWVDGYAIDFNNSDEYISAPTNSVLNDDVDHSLAFTFEPDNVLTAQNIWVQETNDSYISATINSDSTISISHFNTSVYTSANGILSTGTKYRVFHSYDSSAGTGRIWVNNTEYNGSDSGRGGQASPRFRWGQDVDGEAPFDGRFDDFIIMDSTEGAETAKDDYNRQPWS